MIPIIAAKVAKAGAQLRHGVVDQPPKLKTVNLPRFTKRSSAPLPMLAADVLNPGAPFSLVAMKVPADSMVAHMAHVCHMPATPNIYIYSWCEVYGQVKNIMYIQCWLSCKVWCHKQLLWLRSPLWLVGFCKTELYVYICKCVFSSVLCALTCVCALMHVLYQSVWP